MITYRDFFKEEIKSTKPKADMTEIDAPLQQPPSHVQPAKAAAANASMVNQQNLTDAYVVAATIWAEARGEGERGMNAVLNVIMKRSKGDFKNAAKVVLSPKQFSCWNGNSDPRGYAVKLANSQRSKDAKDHNLYLTALKLVDAAMKGQLKDITGDASFYFNPKLARPPWAKKMIKTATIGHHDFYKLPDRKSE